MLVEDEHGTEFKLCLEQLQPVVDLRAHGPAAIAQAARAQQHE